MNGGRAPKEVLITTRWGHAVLTGRLVLMNRQPKTLSELEILFYEKALLVGHRTDNALTTKKSISKEVNLFSVLKCVVESVFSVCTCHVNVPREKDGARDIVSSDLNSAL